jgi:glycosyltransferase involved in cell wall biosynthesis
MEREPGFVSIIVPMRDAEGYIGATLASILSETETPLEVIVVDDRSTDASRARVESFADDRIRLVDGPGRGVAACMNAGLAAARGALVMRCDADDLYPPDRIGPQVAWLRAHPEFVAVCGSFSTIDRRGRTVSDLPCGDEGREITDELRRGIVPVTFGTYAVRLQTMLDLGGFREYFESAEDTDLQLRLGESGRIAYRPDISYFYRIHASSLTHCQSNAVRIFFEQTAHDFQRQRRAGGLDDLQRGRPPRRPEAGAARAYSAQAHIQGILLGRAWREHAAGEKAKALASGMQALKADPSMLSAWRSVLALVWKRAGGTD